MPDPRVEKLADVLVNYSVGVQPGEQVAISGHLLTAPLLREIYRKTLQAGGHPTAIWQDGAMQEILLLEGSDMQIKAVPPPARLIYETYDCLIALWGTDNTRNLSRVDPARLQLQHHAGGELSKIQSRRSAAGEFRWVGAMFPTPAFAQEADMSLRAYEDFVYTACQLDKQDPVAEWQRIHDEQQKLVDWLAGKQQVRVKGPQVDLSLSIAGRVFINSDGRRNMPSGEIFTSPVEESLNGWIRFRYPAIYSGREVAGIELHLENGRIIEASAEKNAELLLSVLDTDEGSRHIGEFGIGTNHNIQRLTRHMLFDEKIGGTIHLAVGFGIPEANGVNQSAIHWDMLCEMRDGGKIWVDDELFYDSGEFVVELPGE